MIHKNLKKVGVLIGFLILLLIVYLKASLTNFRSDYGGGVLVTFTDDTSPLEAKGLILFKGYRFYDFPRTYEIWFLTNSLSSADEIVSAAKKHPGVEDASYALSEYSYNANGEYPSSTYQVEIKVKSPETSSRNQTEAFSKSLYRELADESGLSRITGSTGEINYWIEELVMQAYPNPLKRITSSNLCTDFEKDPRVANCGYLLKYE